MRIKKLEFQVDRIEVVLALHEVPTQVTDNTAMFRRTCFQALPAMRAKLSKVKRLSEDLTTQLEVRNCGVPGAVDRRQM
jgi:hypothetical protein